MNESELKVERLEESNRQEQDNTFTERESGNFSWKISREIDVLTFGKGGAIYLTDCKFTDGDTFYISKSDVDKGLDTAIPIKKCIAKMLGELIGKPVAWELIPVVVRIDMHFRRFKIHNRKYITIPPEARGCSFKITRGKRIATTIIRKGKEA